MKLVTTRASHRYWMTCQHCLCLWNTKRGRAHSQTDRRMATAQQNRHSTCNIFGRTGHTHSHKHTQTDRDGWPPLNRPGIAHEHSWQHRSHTLAQTHRYTHSTTLWINMIRIGCDGWGTLLTLGFLSLEQSEIWSLQEFSCTHTWHAVK